MLKIRETNYDKNDIYYTDVKNYYYLYYDNQFYLTQLTVSKDYNFDKQQINRENFLKLCTFEKLNDELINKLKDANRIATNLGRRTHLFKYLKQDIKRLRSKFNKQILLDYHNFVGFLYLETTVVDKKTSEIIERKTLNVNSQEEKYPPEIISFTQLLKKY